MKLNAKMIDLLMDLSEIESPDNQSFLIGDGLVLRKNLLALYRSTQSPESHALIIQIMAEGGYPWFAKLAKNAGESLIADEQDSIDDAVLPAIMSEDEFLQLVPANGHFH